MTPRFPFARRIFLVAGVYGLVTLFPLYFLEARLARDFPPPVSHPEQYYGFVGLALTWQLVFLVIAHDVARYRLLMLPAVLEKLSFGVAAVALFVLGRVAEPVALAGAIDLVFALLFALAYWASRPGEA